MNDSFIKINILELNKLLACCDPDCALVFLHVKSIGMFSLPRAVSELKLSEERAKSAADKLRKLGLIPDDTAKVAGLPEYTAEDIAARKESDSDFSGLLKEVEKKFGRTITSNDMKVILGILDHYALPSDVCAMLINFTVEAFRKTNGPGRVPPIRFVEKEARHWAERGITTIDSAEEYIARQNEKNDRLSELAQVLQIRGRSLTKTEREYAEKWLDFGFSPEALGIAYDRTIIRTGKLAWKYMDSIVCNWHSAGLHTPEEIAATDRRYSPAAAPAASGEDDAEKYRKMLELL